MSRDLNALFDYECARRPQLAALAARIGSLSIAEIEQARLPMKWMRQVLLARRRQYHQRLAQTRLAASLDDQIVDGVRPDPLGEMRRWTASAGFVRVPHGGALQITPDMLVWLPLSGGVWIETVFTPMVDPLLLQSSHTLGVVKKSVYMTTYRTEINQRIAPDTPVLMTQSGLTGGGGNTPLASVLGTYGVRFR